MTISKHCTTLRQAEQHQQRLYNQYQTVRLVRSPTFTEEGAYVWKIENPKSPHDPSTR